MTIQTLEEVEKEVERFMDRLQNVKMKALQHGKGFTERFTPDWSTGALRRAALDLKVELTKITQNR